MKIVYVILIVAAASWGVFQVQSYNKRQKDERNRLLEAERREELRLRQAEAKEEEDAQRQFKIHAQEREAEAKDKALGLLRAYMEREESRLKGIVAECEKEEEQLIRDCKQVSQVLQSIEETCARNEKLAAERNAKRYDKAEHAILILKNADLNALALKYLGSDFSVLEAECRNRIKTLIRMQSDSVKEIESNRLDYENSMKNLDKDIEVKMAVAKTTTQEANEALEKRLTSLLESRAKKVALVAEMRKRLVSRQVNNEIRRTQDEISELDKEIGKVQEVVNLSRANLSHLAVTEAETAARRKGDRAVMIKAERDNEITRRESHEKAVFLAASQYEARSLDALRMEMSTRMSSLGERQKEAKSKLEYIFETGSNADLLSAQDIRMVREQIAARLREKMIDVSK